MQQALALLNELYDSDVDWLLSAGGEQQVIANTVVIREGEQPTSLYIVLEGLLSVELASTGDRPVGVLGPGEIIGELSFLEEQTAAASVTAIESSLLLVVSRTILDVKLKDDPAFAIRFYRSLAIVIAQRLRQRGDVLGRRGHAQIQAEEAVSSNGARLATAVDQFKALLAQADRAALRHEYAVPEATATEIQRAFRNLCADINAAIGDHVPAHPQVKDELGARLQREMLPYVLLTNAAERCYAKPRGYAGDFLSIETLYQNRAIGAGRLGPVLDRCFLDLKAAAAVRNRRGLLAEEIANVIAQKRGAVARITSLACGPATELFDVFSRIADPSQISANLIDIDLQALAFVADKRDRAKLQRHIQLINANLVYLATGRQKIDLKDQDLIYSIGLTDYFNDKFVMKLLNYIHATLRPGGKVILGNFHPRNPDKAVMDHILDWRLIHRSEADMDRLFLSSSFNRPATNIRFEEQGINLFAECVKG